MLSGLQSGFLHPFSDSAHLVALLALGLVIGQQTRRRLSGVAFGAGLVAGLAALASGMGETPASAVLLALAAAAGLAAATGWPLPAIPGASLALVVGAGIGLDSPPHVLVVSAANAALAGTAAGACLVLGAIAAVTAWFSRSQLRIGPRVLGSWVAASAILVLALRFAR